MKIEFTKMTGTGNDFVIFDSRVSKIPQDDMSTFVRRVCDRHFGVGADGVVILSDPTNKKASLKWTFYNSDGETAEMCGNAARCIVRYASEKLNPKEKTWVIETEAGLVEGKLLQKTVVEIKMTTPKIIDENFKVNLGGVNITVLKIDTGVPHAVIKIDDWSADYLEEMGSTLRKLTKANVTFWEDVSSEQIQSATFERGVEAVTLACGTGAVAAGIAAVKQGKQSPVEIIVPGGTLYVNVSADLKDVSLSGEARFVSEGFLSQEVLV